MCFAMTDVHGLDVSGDGDVRHRIAFERESRTVQTQERAGAAGASAGEVKFAEQSKDNDTKLTAPGLHCLK